jgi:hypothetical protein
MRPSALAALLVTSLPATAAADRLGPAASLSLGAATLPGDVGSASDPYLRIAGGAELGRVAVLVHLDFTSYAPKDRSLDSAELHAWGRGIGVRVDLNRDPGWFAHVEAGVTWRDLRGDGQVRRGCSVFGGCDAGFYLETPAYEMVAPYVAVDVGVRKPSRIWPGVGAQLGLSPLVVDRSGMAPDDRGALVWLSAHVALGVD